ncbi:MAG TPA: glycoside hydrolase family 76 protein [Solirubrobacteraceae bacterium]|nr:glycoside hydrolase family 76 protein [Solirubrobacteraceae bacterium]
MPHSKRQIPNRFYVAGAALVAALVVVAVVLVVTGGGSGTSFPFSSLGGSKDSGTAGAESVGSQSYLELAEAGIEKTSAWWDGSAGWFYGQLGAGRNRAQVTLWGSNGMFEALDEIAIADPTPATRAAVETFARGEQRYWNPNRKPVPGYSPEAGEHGASQPTWYDDNAWIGIAFLDAYRATGNRTYVSDAERAFRFIAAGGWDSEQGGGMWWSTEHQWLSGEALAAASDLAARLYQTTGGAEYLTDAETYIGWANKNLLTPQGVYLPVARTPYPYLIEPDSYVNRGGAQPPGSYLCREGSGTCKPGSTEVAPCKAGSKGCTPGTMVIVKCGVGLKGCKSGATFRTGPPGGAVSRGPGGAANKEKASNGPKRVAMPHDGEGAMVAAMTALCEATGKQSWCTEADQRALDDIKWLAPFADGPQYDSVLIRGLLALYSKNHDARLYDFAVKLAGLITKHAQSSPNVYLRGWDGRAIPSNRYGSLLSDAGSISVFADLAMVRPPSSAQMRAADGAVSGRVSRGPA